MLETILQNFSFIPQQLLRSWFFFRKFCFWLPWEPIKLRGYNKKGMFGRGPLKVHFCKSFVKISARVATLMQKQNSLTFHWLFPDQIQFFTDQNTVVLRPICLLAADKWQIPFTGSLNCNSLILQMKEIKSINSFLAQNVLKLTSFHGPYQANRVTEKNQHCYHISSSKNTCYNKYFGTKLWNLLTFPWLSSYLKFPWPICKIPRLFPDLEEKIKFPWLVPDQWPPWSAMRYSNNFFLLCLCSC